MVILSECFVDSFLTVCFQFCFLQRLHSYMMWRLHHLLLCIGRTWCKNTHILHRGLQDQIMFFKLLLNWLLCKLYAIGLMHELKVISRISSWSAGESGVTCELNQIRRNMTVIGMHVMMQIMLMISVIQVTCLLAKKKKIPKASDKFKSCTSRPPNKNSHNRKNKQTNKQTNKGNKTSEKQQTKWVYKNVRCVARHVKNW